MNTQRYEMNSNHHSENDVQQLSYSEIIYLMDIYEREWEHRDSLLWKQAYRMYYLSLISMILPNISNYIGLTLPNIPPKIFPIIGLLLACFSMIMSWSYGVRLEASSETYKNLMRKLPVSYRRVNINELYRIKGKDIILKLPGKEDSIFMWVQTKVLVLLLFLTEAIIAVIIVIAS